MPTLENLQAKRADLVASLEQYVGQINRVNGAVAVLDDLIAEVKAEEASSAAQSLLDAINTAKETEAPPLAPVLLDEDAYTPMTPPPPHRMMPVLDEDAPYLAPASDAA